jgi:hypothetical protein
MLTGWSGITRSRVAWPEDTRWQNLGAIVDTGIETADLTNQDLATRKLSIILE